MPLRRSDPVRSRTRGAAGGHDLRRQRLFAGTADHPDVEAAFGQQPRRLRIIGPALGGADRARRQCDGRTGAQPIGLPPAAGFLGGNPELRHRPFARQRRAVGQRQRRILVDEAGQGLLAPAPLVEQPEPGFADKSHPFRNPGQRGRDRRLPGAGQHQRGAVAAGPQLLRQPPLPGHRKPAARQVPDDPGAHAGHIIDQRGAQRGDEQVDRPVRPALLQHPHHGMAADKIADPHIGHDQDRTGVVRILRSLLYIESMFIS